MSADTAPAAMPGVEDVARLLCKLDGLNPDLPRSWADKELLWTEWLDPARQVIALFAPILAENEAYRQNRHFVMGFNAGFDAACEQGLGAAAIRAQGE